MIPVHDLNPENFRTIRGFFFDIDDTLTSRGKLLPAAFGSLWKLKQAGFILVPVTGRPAGWCDHIARFWPVDGVVGENGGFYFFHDGQKLRRRFIHDEEERSEFRNRLGLIREEILREVPGSALASDQPYREYDLAIDYCEDVAPLPMEQAVKIRDIFLHHGAHARISSIHVNGWFGDFDKLSTVKLFARERLNSDLETENEAFAFCGDSPNDEPMFEFFRHSFAVANIRRFERLILHRPACVALGEGGEGFAEIAEFLLQSRRGRNS